MLDPANYSPVTINNSISIVADAGGPAAIVLPTGNAITINAGSTGVVNLRGLTLDGEGTAASGILLNNAASLIISDCFARNFTNSGVLLNLGAIYVPNQDYLIQNSVLNNNGTGLTVDDHGGPTPVVTMRNSVANYNGTGISASAPQGPNLIFELADTMVTGNSTYGISVANSLNYVVVESYGDNDIHGNGTDVSGITLTPVAKQ